MGGEFVTNQKALIDFTFPELSDQRKVTYICHVDGKTNREKAMYDIIIGMDLMTEIGIVVDTEAKTIRWDGASTPLKTRGTLQSTETLNMLYHTAINRNSTPVLAEAEKRQNRILDADYSQVQLDEFVRELKHLTIEEQTMLLKVLKSHPTLFGGGLGVLNVKPIHLELKPGAQPYHARPFAIPQAYRATTRKEVDRLEAIGVFERIKETEWAAATFIQPKKTGDVRILTDFRKLNAAIKRKPFPLPKISELLQRLRGFKYATAIDLSMGYYHIPLDAASQRLCTTVFEWGKYCYKRLPMGIKNSPDIFQAIMMELAGDLDYASTYLDDILITSNGSFNDHLQKVDEVLNRLERAGFRANVRKCFFAEQQLEYLGYWITRQGIQPQPKGN